MRDSATPEAVGEFNRKMLLDYVRKNGPTSRADLHRKLNMSAPTVSANVKRLIETGFLLEAGDAGNAIGRKATLVTFNEKRGYVVGADIGRWQMRLSVADLLGNVVASLREFSDLENMSAQLLRMMDTALAEAQVDSSLVNCIALGVPGVLDPKTGDVIQTPLMGMIDLKELRETLAAKYRAHVLIGNSAKYGAIGEKWQGVAQKYHHIIYLSCGVGICAGLILNDELYCGASGAAGEIGYMLPDVDSMLDHLGESGALEMKVSGSAIRANMDAYGGRDKMLAALQGNPPDDACREYIDGIIRTIGIVMVNLTAMFNPEAIVIGGGFGDLLAAHCLPTWEETLRRHVPFVPDLLASELHSQANVLGAVATAMRYANDSCFESKLS